MWTSVAIQLFIFLGKWLYDKRLISEGERRLIDKLQERAAQRDRNAAIVSERLPSLDDSWLRAEDASNTGRLLSADANDKADRR